MDHYLEFFSLLRLFLPVRTYDLGSFYKSVDHITIDLEFMVFSFQQGVPHE